MPARVIDQIDTVAVIGQLKMAHDPAMRTVLRDRALR